MGLAGSLGGLVWAIGLHLTERIQVRFARFQWVLLGALTIGAGAVAGYAYWDNQDVWTPEANALATLAAGFAASTAGALAGVTAAMYAPPTNSGHT